MTRFLRCLFLSLLTLLFSAMALASVGSVIDGITAAIPVSGPIFTLILFVYDLVRRYVPTINPGGLFYDVSTVLKALAALFTKVGQLLDGIAGQSKSSG